MVAALLSPLWGGTLAQEGLEDHGGLSESVSAQDLPEVLRDDPRLAESWGLWRRELAHRDSLQLVLDGIQGRAQVLGLRIQGLERDPETNVVKDRTEEERLLREGERIREEEDRISVELALARQRIRLAAKELSKTLDLVLEDFEEPLPPDVAEFRESVMAWGEQVPILPVVEVVVREDDTPDILRDKANYLRDLADRFDGLADLLQLRIENMNREARLLEGAEQILEDAMFFDDGGFYQDQGEVPLRVRIEGGGDSHIARGASVLLVTPEQSWELFDLLDARPSTERQLEAIRSLLQAAHEDVAFQSDSLRARAGRLDEAATSREAP